MRPKKTDTEMKAYILYRKGYGHRLKNFRQDLELKLQGRKVDQKELIPGFNEGMISGYERGEDEMPARLLWEIWKAGWSIDALFCGEARRHGLMKPRRQQDIIGDDN